MKYLWIMMLFFVSCQTTGKTLNSDAISEQVRAYEEELKSVVSLNLARQDYKKGATSLEMFNYRVDMYIYERKKNRKEGFLVGLPLSKNPTKEEFEQAESYLLDQIRIWQKKRE